MLSIEMDLAKGGVIDRSPFIVESPLKFASTVLLIIWQFGTQLATVHTALAAAFLFHHA